MIIQNVHFVFDAADADKAESILRDLRDASRGEAGVIAFEVGRDPKKPTAFGLWEVYRDQAALDSHMSSEHFKRLVVNGVRPLAKERVAVMLSPI